MADETPLAEALKGRRECYWEVEGGFKETPIFDWDALKPGNRLKGPAIIEASTTTVVVEPGWVFLMDPYKNGILKQDGKN
jgi:N-methylhydantoinase A/oxoprolinase/acetone carboxylase beta subunit